MLTQENFGSALRGIEFEICFTSKPESKPLPKEITLFSEYHVPPMVSRFNEYHNWLNAIQPSRTFQRKKAKLEIAAIRADFAFAEDIFPESPEACRERNECYMYEWQLEVLKLVIAELDKCRKKFNSKDDFDYPKFMKWVYTLPEQIPRTKPEAMTLIKQMEQQQSQIYEQMSPWEKLGIDWDDFHPAARDIIPDPRLWDEAYDFSPNGNDTGADVFSMVQEQKRKLKTAKDEGKSFYKKVWTDVWGFSWPPNREPDDNHDYTAHPEFVIGMDYSYLKLFGQCPEWLRSLALNEIVEYQEYLTTHHQDWEYLNEALEMQKITKDILIKSKL